MFARLCHNWPKLPKDEGNRQTKSHKIKQSTCWVGGRQKGDSHVGIARDIRDDTKQADNVRNYCEAELLGAKGTWIGAQDIRQCAKHKASDACKKLSS